ncbi:MAG: DUF3021 domain-containing protein [Brachybacterium sp.]|uniref:DUF3021 family protein n=1 Tax=Brachybacterium sp. TaxID=1891286 RepID=UPI0026479FD6|nr:DUF3021 family protein [Brachybacterium sp.]MDN5685970.1 DUF3021 domain-containing protein [Brachybacterium sp.]
MPAAAKVAVRAGVPAVIMTGIGVALLAEGEVEDGRSTIAVGIIVAAVAGSSVIYEVERWGLLRQSLVHVGVMVVTVLPVLLLSGWFPLDTVRGFLIVIGTFLLAGAVLWSMMFLVFTALVPAVKRLGSTRSSRR